MKLYRQAMISMFLYHMAYRWCRNSFQQLPLSTNCEALWNSWRSSSGSHRFPPSYCLCQMHVILCWRTFPRTRQKFSSSSCTCYGKESGTTYGIFADFVIKLCVKLGLTLSEAAYTHTHPEDLLRDSSRSFLRYVVWRCSYSMVMLCSGYLMECHYFAGSQSIPCTYYL